MPHGSQYCTWVQNSHYPESPYIRQRSSKCLPPHYVSLNASRRASGCIIGYCNPSCRLCHDIPFGSQYCIWVLYSHCPESPYFRQRSSKCLPSHYFSLQPSGGALRCIIGYCNPSCRLLHDIPFGLLFMHMGTTQSLPREPLHPPKVFQVPTTPLYSTATLWGSPYMRYWVLQPLMSTSL
jgi:hypothetical protein